MQPQRSLSTRPVLLILSLLATILFSTSSPAYGAAFSNNNAVIDWNSFSFVTSPGMSLSFQDRSSTSFGAALTPSSFLDDFLSADGWDTTSTFASIATSSGSASGSAFTDSSTLSATAIASSVFGSLQADAAALRSAEFIVSGGGSLTVSVDYNLSQNLGTSVFGEFAEGFAFAGLLLYYDDLSTVVGDTDFILNSLFDGDSLFDSRAGTLSATLFFNDGQGGFFDFLGSGHSAVTAVPEPSTVILLGVGLVSFGLLRKRLKRRA